MKNILLTIWQLPQIILGILVYAWAIWVNGATEDPSDDSSGNSFMYVRWDYFLSLSLCRYIFVNRDASKELKEYMRKYLLLSEIFGWFYLPVFGIVRLWKMIFKKDNK